MSWQQCPSYLYCVWPSGQQPGETNRRGHFIRWKLRGVLTWQWTRTLVLEGVFLERPPFELRTLKIRCSQYVLEYVLCGKTCRCLVCTRRRWGSCCFGEGSDGLGAEVRGMRTRRHACASSDGLPGQRNVLEKATNSVANKYPYLQPSKNSLPSRAAAGVSEQAKTANGRRNRPHSSTSPSSICVRKH